MEKSKIGRKFCVCIVVPSFLYSTYSSISLPSQYIMTHTFSLFLHPKESLADALVNGLGHAFVLHRLALHLLLLLFLLLLLVLLLTDCLPHTRKFLLHPLLMFIHACCEASIGGLSVDCDGVKFPVHQIIHIIDSSIQGFKGTSLEGRKKGNINGNKEASDNIKVRPEGLIEVFLVFAGAVSRSGGRGVGTRRHGGVCCFCLCSGCVLGVCEREWAYKFSREMDKGVGRKQKQEGSAWHDTRHKKQMDKGKRK